MMPSAAKSRLGDSWVVNESDEGDMSWDGHEDNTDSDLDQEPLTTKQRKGKTTRTGNPPLTSARGSSSQPEPQFIMPSIEQPLRRSATPSEQTRKRAVKHARPVSTPKSRSSGLRSKSPQTRSPTVDHESLSDSVIAFITHIAQWALDILGGSLKTLRQPLSWLLAAWLFIGLLTLGRNLLTSSIYTALSPICRIPGVSLLNLPVCHYNPLNPNTPTISPGMSPPVEFDALMRTQSQFEEILTASASGVSLPLDMKRSETSIRDLKTIITYSSLPSRHELTLEFDSFITLARQASYDLQKFNSHTGRAVDIVLSTARWTQRVLDDMSYAHSSPGLIPRVMNTYILAPFQPLSFTTPRLLDQYIQHTRIISDEIDSLIAEAQALLLLLTNLEDRLDVIHAISTRDNHSAQTSKEEILTHLWTLVGGNRAKLGRFNNQLKLLGQVGEYRKIAFAHVSGVILKLQAMGAELEELRTRVGSAETLRDAGVQGIPLEVHLESIRLGVERLEIGREKARTIEQSYARRVIDAGQRADSLEGTDERAYIERR